ncbi:DUF1353 domain-containing protein, partial [Cellulomonas endophytica]|uniref:DUF1353 domain-containing protein n=1 Tax=Cellulomonas endophytica TaxID=2494735 RepID=UPI001010443E
MPFLARDAAGTGWVAAATVDLRQLAVRRRWRVEFELLADLGWTDAPPTTTGPGGTARWDAAAVTDVVPRGSVTDLASVPEALWGVLASYGRQTLPALLHDHRTGLVAGVRTAPARRRARREADDLFLRTLEVQGSGPVRRRLLWAGVRVWGHRVPTAGAVLLLLALGATAVLGARPAVVAAAAVGAVVTLVGVLVAAVEADPSGPRGGVGAAVRAGGRGRPGRRARRRGPRDAAAPAGGGDVPRRAGRGGGGGRRPGGGGRGRSGHRGA